MGIETMGQGREGLCLATGMDGGEPCVLLSADLLRGCSRCSEEMGGRSGQSGWCAGGRRFFWEHVTSALA